MPVVSKSLHLSTRGNGDVIDITAEVQGAIAESGLTAGIGCVFVPGATGAVTTIELEPGCVADFAQFWERVAPAGEHYEHARTAGDDNGHSHVRAAVLGPSLAFPFSDGAATLGTWQQIVFVDFDDRARTRQLMLQLVGE